MPPEGARCRTRAQPPVERPVRHRHEVVRSERVSPSRSLDRMQLAFHSVRASSCTIFSRSVRMICRPSCLKVDWQSACRLRACMFVKSDERTIDSNSPTSDDLEVILPTQLDSKAGHGRFGLAPAQALMLAVLEDAAICYSWRKDSRPQQRRLAHQAEQWVRSGETQDLFAFQSVCTHLDLDPATVRRQILQTPPRESGRRRRRSHRVDPRLRTSAERARKRAGALSSAGRSGRTTPSDVSLRSKVRSFVDSVVAPLLRPADLRSTAH